ncbi:hypothetical protein EBO23_04325 [Micrococcus luteus]|nr:hypothetical protein EBO23_04325 [Micrococcus luteus]
MMQQRICLKRTVGTARLKRGRRCAEHEQSVRLGSVARGRRVPRGPLARVRPSALVAMRGGAGADVEGAGAGAGGVGAIGAGQLQALLTGARGGGGGREGVGLAALVFQSGHGLAAPGAVVAVLAPRVGLAHHVAALRAGLEGGGQGVEVEKVVLRHRRCLLGRGAGGLMPPATCPTIHIQRRAHNIIRERRSTRPWS